ncbi:DUF1496 domain-containing protein [Bradyrhizobium lablabi]|uniref:DUF1496 domain-containing protein n=1 Tax=Bradyrhizobium lablabi TaxID=722472 RepID=UPI001BADB618|nr:DUF1496 domain-containing protein [Bradyrhizobium lablabi]MBR1126012.1 DUF1496 domain-containing protein [Bradyrhizobium lablabi]
MKFSLHILACSMSLAILPALPAPVLAQNARVCVYDSQTYSEGAAVCVRANLMINCSASGERMVWTIVADRDTARLCGSETVSRYHRRSARVAARIAAPPARAEADASKCFNFNGRRYCE